MEAESSLWATLGCGGVFFGPSASHREEKSYHIERAEVKQCVKNSKKKRKKMELLTAAAVCSFHTVFFDL